MRMTAQLLRLWRQLRFSHLMSSPSVRVTLALHLMFLQVLLLLQRLRLLR